MPRRKEPIKYAKVKVKDCWHPYGLQGLSPQKFAHVSDEILSGKFGLLNLRERKDIQPSQATM